MWYKLNNVQAGDCSCKSERLCLKSKVTMTVKLTFAQASVNGQLVFIQK